MTDCSTFGIHAARFFADKGSFSGGIVTLSDSDAKHITHVLRMRDGELITVCDGDGTDYLCELIPDRRSDQPGCQFVQPGRRSKLPVSRPVQPGRRSDRFDRSVRARVIGSSPSLGEPLTKVTLWQSIPRSEKFDFVTQKCVEAGVTAIVPVISERTQVIPGEAAESRVARWRRICYEAAKQSGRGIVPEVREPLSFTDAIDFAAGRVNTPRTTRTTRQDPSPAPCSSYCIGLIPYERETDMTLKAVLKSLRDSFTGMNLEDSTSPIPIEVHLFIGSEGGYSQTEIDAATSAGIVPLTLGKRIFRTETAGLAAICCILYELDSG